MPEDAWMRTQREYFVRVEATGLGIAPKNLNKALESYNKFLQDSLIDESPFVAEDLKLTIEKARGAIEPKQ
jgi:hypothetical protein